MAKYDKLASSIIKMVGGQNNIRSLTHCATRLRFVLKDESQADKTALEALPEVITVVKASGQYQVVIGPTVSEVYQAIIKQLPSLSSDNQTPAKEDSQQDAQKKKWYNVVFDVISGSFTPLIPVFCGSGLIKALCSILTLTGILTAKDSTYAILAAAGNAVFYFMPIILAVAVARKLSVNPYIAAAIGAALMEPNFTALASKSGNTFFGIPVIISNYSSSVFPAFLAITGLYFLDKLLKKIIPEVVHLILVPFLEILIMVPVTVFIFGPFGNYVSSALTKGILALLKFNAPLAGAILGMAWIYIVTLGLHWALMPIALNNIVTLGSDPIMGLIMGSTWCIVGTAIGVFFKTKDEKLKQVAISGFVPALLSGVGEPILYGILFRYKRSLLWMTIMSGVAGLLAGIFNVKATQVAGGIFTIPTFNPIWGYLIVIGVAIVGTALLNMVFGYGELTDKKG